MQVKTELRADLWYVIHVDEEQKQFGLLEVQADYTENGKNKEEITHISFGNKTTASAHIHLLEETGQDTSKYRIVPGHKLILLGHEFFAETGKDLWKDTETRAISEKLNLKRRKKREGV